MAKKSRAKAAKTANVRKAASRAATAKPSKASTTQAKEPAPVAAAPADAQTTKTPATTADPQVVRRLAHAIWDTDLQTRKPGASPSERKEDWDAERKGYTLRARRIIRLLERNSVTLTFKAE